MRASHERVVSRLAIAVPIPAFVVAMWLLWSGDFFPRLQWTVSIILGIVTGALVAKLRGEVLRPLMTLSNMLAAIREHDYSLRARHANPEDAMGLAMFEVNELMNELRERRLGALDAAALLQRVITEIDVAVFAAGAEMVAAHANVSRVAVSRAVRYHFSSMSNQASGFDGRSCGANKFSQSSR